MNKTKNRILEKALHLYNEKGVANTSIRQIANEAHISHSNLIYHFSSHEEIIVGLHNQLLEKAIQLNQELFNDNSILLSFFERTKSGFKIVSEYQFLFLNLHYLCSTYSKIKLAILSVEQIRSEMYRGLIAKLVAQNIMRTEEFDGEYDILINQIKLFSDHWIVSSFIYDNMMVNDSIEKYAFQLMNIFYPYLSESGKIEFNKIQITAPVNPNSCM